MDLAQAPRHALEGGRDGETLVEQLRRVVHVRERRQRTQVDRGVALCRRQQLEQRRVLRGVRLRNPLVGGVAVPVFALVAVLAGASL